ncbi:phage integrase SAM-like domain-containing protein [Niabella beijingensis]|uniref:phage integrase SAM-like domain-containing protein n=1 Tax=Niabella beijingensis TaxID=2872700 RepID=UPI001CBBDDE1|nr:phage integrase SAM-like domain-containing protein [Niabella beijingensis]MBZ4191922.1 phage integrase SAM-like domain-containing protein [Niabella beijingensis]
MNFLKIANKKGDKFYYYYDYGRCKGQRPSTGVFTYKTPKTQVQKNHNKEALLILETKKSQLTIEAQATGGVYIPHHKFKPNFLDYYCEYVKLNKKDGNRHLENSLTHFKNFINKDFISNVEVTENFCKRFRQYLLERFNGETPMNYYARFKWVVKAATKDKYFHSNPTEDISAVTNPSTGMKENLEADEYIQLLRTPCSNQEVGARSSIGWIAPYPVVYSYQKIQS